ncbi:MAG: hypothetical protein AAF702_14180 [Chloroflexota bacterium]
MSGISWWLVMAPGLLLISVAIAILIWPELLAYIVASVIFFIGTSVTGWGWSLRQAERRRMRQQSQMDQNSNASDAVIYYER